MVWYRIRLRVQQALASFRPLRWRMRRYSGKLWIGWLQLFLKGWFDVPTVDFWTTFDYQKVLNVCVIVVLSGKKIKMKKSTWSTAKMLPMCPEALQKIGCKSTIHLSNGARYARTPTFWPAPLRDPDLVRRDSWINPKTMAWVKSRDPKPPEFCWTCHFSWGKWNSLSQDKKILNHLLRWTPQVTPNSLWMVVKQSIHR